MSQESVSSIKSALNLVLCWTNSKFLEKLFDIWLTVDVIKNFNAKYFKNHKVFSQKQI